MEKDGIPVLVVPVVVSRVQRRSRSSVPSERSVYPRTAFQMDQSSILSHRARGPVNRTMGVPFGEPWTVLWTPSLRGKIIPGLTHARTGVHPA